MCLPPITIVNSPSRRYCSRPRACRPPYREPLLQPLSPEAYGFPAQMPPTGVVTAMPLRARCYPVPMGWIDDHHACEERVQAQKEEKREKEVVYIKEAKKEDADHCPCSSKKKCACDHRRRRRSSASSSSSRSYKEVTRKICDLWNTLDQQRCRGNIEKEAQREEQRRGERQSRYARGREKGAKRG